MSLSSFRAVRRCIFVSAIAGLAFTFVDRAAFAQGTIPCPTSSSYGTADDQHAQDIDEENGTQYPNVNSVLSTQINTSKEDRNTAKALGCPVDSYTWVKPKNGDTAPVLSNLISDWNTNHVPLINSYVTNVADVCPDAGRTGGAYGLAGYYVQLAGAGAGMSGLTKVTLGNLEKIELMLYREQYSAYTMNTGTTQPSGAGVFGYINANGLTPGASYPYSCATVSGDPYWSLSQYPAGTSNLSVDVASYCSQASAPCVTYQQGLYADKTLPLNFQVTDLYSPIDSGPVPDGAMAYDEGWAGVSMMEATLQQPAGVDLTAFQSTLALAGQWATNETPVRDENYTSKLVWLLAELYDRTGSSIYQQALLNKLNNDVLLDVLMDDGSGDVKGLTKVPFSGLTNVAQTPGRMWDGP